LNFLVFPSLRYFVFLHYFKNMGSLQAISSQP
jgi:hypothetical protein